MSVQVESTERFLRPTDVDRVRRNYRSIQMQRLIIMLRNFVLLVIAATALVMLYQRTQSDRRFAVQHLEITGAQHTTRAELELVRQRYIGANLFNLDIARIRRDLSSLQWVSRVEIEKKLPDTLRIQIAERTPVALAEEGGKITYVDDRGAAFAELSPSAGDADLPLITGAGGDDLSHCVAILTQLRTHDSDLYSRISEIRPLPARGFALFDRELHAFVYANEEDLSSRWRDLRAIARAENFKRGEIAYADLRFNGQVVIKPLRAMPAVSTMPRPRTPMQITN